MLTTKPFIAYNITWPYIYWDNFFTEEELTEMELYFNSQNLEEAKLASGVDGVTNSSVRITSVAIIQSKDENNWIFHRLLQLTDAINSQFYNYDLLGFDYLQYTIYDKAGSHYSYHMDMVMDDKTKGGLELPRKLSFSLILSEKEDFEGGEFEITISENGKITPEQKRGRVLAFPSFILHRVTPVTSGIRKSLVFWACGPKFK